jgi:hypothetical protein
MISKRMASRSCMFLEFMIWKHISALRLYSLFVIKEEYVCSSVATVPISQPLV